MDAIILENISKKFKKNILKSDHSTLKTALVNLFRPSKDNRPKSFYTEALENFNIKIEKGTTLGIIGTNGSGKSTLLKIIAGIYKPDSGNVTTNGMVSALIELGAGFHPDFTGRENVLIYGLILGLSKKEILAKFDEIVHFAEMEEFIDCPVRTYSSGMYARLGFSVAVNVNPDILLIDEVLAVGDENFAEKCHEKMTLFKERGKTILLVTHNSSVASSWCNQCLWLDKGKIKFIGDAQECVDLFHQHMRVNKNQVELYHEQPHKITTLP